MAVLQSLGAVTTRLQKNLILLLDFLSRCLLSSPVWGCYVLQAYCTKVPTFKELSFEELRLSQPACMRCTFIRFDAAAPVCISLLESCPCVCVLPKILVWCKFEVQAVMFFLGLVVTWGGWCRKRGVCVALSEVVPLEVTLHFSSFFPFCLFGSVKSPLLEVQL